MPFQEEEESQICMFAKKRGTQRIIWHMSNIFLRSLFGEYLDKDVYESQGCYDNSKDGSGGNDNYHGGERNEEGAQEHEHGGGQSLVYDVDVLGEAVQDASYRRGVKERLGCVKFVGEQVMVQLLGCADVSRG